MAIENVAVFCASSSNADGDYVADAEALGRAIVAAGWSTVYGGGGTGLMGAVARSVLAAGGTIVGIRPDFISDFEGDQMGLTELIRTGTMHERIQMLFDRSDAFVTLPGSCGTLDEVVQAITWKRLALHTKPIALLNTNGYFDPLLVMFERMVEGRFVSPQYTDLYRVCASVDEVVSYLRTYVPPAAVPI